MAKPSALVTAFGGAFASVAGQTISMVASKFKSGYGGGSREYPAPKSLNFLLNNLFGWTDWLDSITLADGRLKQQTKTLPVAGAAFVSVVGTITYGLNQCSGTNFTFVAPIILPTGKRITAVRMFIIDSVTGPSKVQASVYSGTPAGGTTLLGSSSLSLGNATLQTLTVSGLTTTVVAGSKYVIQAQSTGGATCVVYGAEVDYDELV